MRANDLTMMATPPRWRGSSAACSRDEPSPAEHPHARRSAVARTQGRREEQDLVVLPGDGPLARSLLVGARNVGDGAELARELVLDAVRLLVLRVERADEHVVADVVQVP